MSKKKSSDIWLYLGVGFCLLLTIGVTCNLIKIRISFPEEFTITKEECHTFFICYNQDGELINFPYTPTKVENLSCSWEKGNPQECGQVEVDGIWVSDEQPIIDPNCQKDRFCEGERFGIRDYIKTQDLTKEWLNENADRCSIYLPQEGIELWTDQNKINQINGRTCSKWQLGEYTIEVKQ